ncbi:TetR/AcrR family transcriptional regulator [Paraburkholderia sp.]|uniref:TetR/AcrR family transcriptional regulator n=1 Tax=Paraburkholderia sp. TaxID=1926495 RepID=UPI0023980F48|nr:TetR/AcrR family transcriptional regulator [Paraburkholderia sp.]MDE1184026.1 TetR/AcrR family transcriptional regulator [Paraburkholderia sp.]
MGIAERKNRQKVALRERILDAARRIVMREGFAALSMRKIADAIEYSPATLYLHFASRDEIAQALCSEGYAQLLATFSPAAHIADPAERLKAIGRAYVAFGTAHPQTYRLIFMEDPAYTGATLIAADANNDGDEALRMMIAAFDELKAAGRIASEMNSAVCAEALWATLHGIVSLRLTCSVFPSVSLESVLETSLAAWFGGSVGLASTGSPASGVPQNRVASDQPDQPDDPPHPEADAADPPAPRAARSARPRRAAAKPKLA